MRRITPDIIWFTILATLFHQSGFLFILFLVPLQAIRNRKDFKTLLMASAAFLSAVLVMAVARSGGLDNQVQRTVFIMSEIIVPAYLLAGFLYINYDWPGNPRMLKKMIVAVTAAFIIGIPVILFYQNRILQDFYMEQLKFAIDYLKSMLAQADSVEAGDIADIIKSVTPEILAETLKKSALRTYLYWYFLILSANWWLGSSGIRYGKWKSALNPSRFTMPDFMVWPLIISLLLVLVDRKSPVGVLGYISWNILLIMVTLYGYKGFGIIQNLMKILKFPPPMRIMIIFTLSLMLVQPGIHYFILIGIPLLGVSEIWIKYEKNLKEN